MGWYQGGVLTLKFVLADIDICRRVHDRRSEIVDHFDLKKIAREVPGNRCQRYIYQKILRDKCRFLNRSFSTYYPLDESRWLLH